MFGLKPQVIPFGKMAIFDVLNFLFLWPRKACFRSRISSKTFSWPILPKKKDEKSLFLDQKHGLTLLEKCQFFDFKTSCFIAQKGVFVVLEYRKRYFPGLYWLKKEKLEKWPFFHQNDGLTPFEKCQFFNFLIFCFLQTRKAFFSIQKIVKNIFLAYIA